VERLVVGDHGAAFLRNAENLYTNVRAPRRQCENLISHEKSELAFVNGDDCTFVEV